MRAQNARGTLRLRRRLLETEQFQAIGKRCSFTLKFVPLRVLAVGTPTCRKGSATS